MLQLFIICPNIDIVHQTRFLVHSKVKISAKKSIFGDISSSTT
jgi:hypothetical protein